MERSIKEVIGKFKDGEKLYNTSSLFNKCVNSIALGGDVYELLEAVILIVEEQTSTMKDIIQFSSVPQRIFLENAGK